MMYMLGLAHVQLAVQSAFFQMQMMCRHRSRSLTWWDLDLVSICHLLGIHTTTSCMYFSALQVR